jgi:hypothetical protein
MRETKAARPTATSCIGYKTNSTLYKLFKAPAAILAQHPLNKSNKTDKEYNHCTYKKYH